jgi:hypothetical protein
LGEQGNGIRGAPYEELLIIDLDDGDEAFVAQGNGFADAQPFLVLADADLRRLCPQRFENTAHTAAGPVMPANLPPD